MTNITEDTKERNIALRSTKILGTIVDFIYLYGVIYMSFDEIECTIKVKKDIVVDCNDIMLRIVYRYKYRLTGRGEPLKY